MGISLLTCSMNKRERAIYDNELYRNNPTVRQKKYNQAIKYYYDHKEEILKRLKIQRMKEKIEKWWKKMTDEKKCSIMSDIYHDTISGVGEANRIFNDVLDDNQREGVYLAYREE